MARYIDPTGRSTYGIGICGRCKLKFSLEDLKPDPNFPGLMVCEADRDVLDPYRKPPRQPENITLAFARPDEPLSNRPSPWLLATGFWDDQGFWDDTAYWGAGPPSILPWILQDNFWEDQGLWDDNALWND